jgi:hypothetical protein
VNNARFDFFESIGFPADVNDPSDPDVSPPQQHLLDVCLLFCGMISEGFDVI